MLEPFIWMFKTNGFLRYFLKLLFVSILLVVIGVSIIFSTTFLVGLFRLSPLIIMCLGILVVCSPILFIQGYFWELVSSIIDRDTDIIASNIYNGKTKQILSINLPEWGLFKFIWRGFASIVATSIMLIPWAIVLYAALSVNEVAIDKFDLVMACKSEPIIGIPILMLSIIFNILSPGLLWNYAKNNSVVSTLNIPKAIFLFGNYTFKYIFNLILIWVLYFVDALITIFLFKIANFNGILQSLNNQPLTLTVLIITALFLLCKWLYYIHVYAYLLGTIAPKEEW